MNLSVIRRSGLVALGVLVTGTTLAGGASTALADCPRDNPDFCQPPEPTEPRPDLRMSTVYNTTHVVIQNIGNARAGTFKVVIGGAGNVPAQSVRISGLAAGASTKIAAQSACEVSRQVKVDVLNEVIESNETNNTGFFPGKVC
jgi:hypothetical protein